MDTLALVISIVLAVVAIAGGIFGVLAYVTQRKQAKIQAEALAAQFKHQEEARQKQVKEQEERQKSQNAEQYGKLKTDLAEQKASADKNNMAVNMRLESIEKKTSGIEKMNTEIELIKRDSSNILKAIEEIKDNMSYSTSDAAPPTVRKRRTYTRKEK